MTPEAAAAIAGYVSAAVFVFQYIPQIHKNHARRSTEGFSTEGMALKLVGSAFLFANYFLDTEQPFVLLYSFTNMMQYIVMLSQAALFASDGKYRKALYLLIPFPIFALSMAIPDTRALTTGIKPLTQVSGNILLVLECVRVRSVGGVSLASQTLNVAGGASGLYACLVLPTKSAWAKYLYINSVTQGLAIFFLAIIFRGGSGRLNPASPRGSPTHEASVPGSEIL
ncbi:hypothetical protein DIPPA_26461 [Diplonema papillatum]|nr:hypothetical protein DIPPA_26461 [Diplonema papillatum]